MASTCGACPSCGSLCQPRRAVVPSASGPKPFSSNLVLESFAVKGRLQRYIHHTRQASKSKSSEHAPDNGTDERKSSNSEAGTSGSNKHAGQKPGKTPNKQASAATCSYCRNGSTCSLSAQSCKIFSWTVCCRQAADTMTQNLMACAPVCCSALVDFSENFCFIESRDSVKVCLPSHLCVDIII